jgi:hypothetical protein
MESWSLCPVCSLVTSDYCSHYSDSFRRAGERCKLLNVYSIEGWRCCVLLSDADQPVAREQNVAHGDFWDDKTSFDLFFGKTEIERQSSFENLKL